MKRIVHILIFLLITMAGYSQQEPMYSQYLNHPLMVNSAFSGFKNYNPLRFTTRQQWVGIEGAPSTQVLSYHGRIGRSNFYDNRGLLNNENQFDDEGNIVRKRGAIFSGKAAIGGLIYNDRHGAINKTGVKLAYAYHTKLEKIRDRFNKSPTLSVSANFSMSQFVLDESKLTTYEGYDPLIEGSKESIFLPDIGISALVYTPNYYFGLSAQNLLQSKIMLNGSNDMDNKLTRHYYFMAAYKYETQGDVFLEPNILVKATEFSPIQFDLGARVITKNVNAGINYRTNNDIILMIGLKTGRYYFGYSFDYSFGNIIQYSTGSHELVIGYNIGEDNYTSYAY